MHQTDPEFEFLNSKANISTLKKKKKSKVHTLFSMQLHNTASSVHLQLKYIDLKFLMQLFS